MKYVLDVSVALSWVMRRPATPKALRCGMTIGNPFTSSSPHLSFPQRRRAHKLIPIGQARRLLANLGSAYPVIPLSSIP